jgi:hypothetical protein
MEIITTFGYDTKSPKTNIGSVGSAVHSSTCPLVVYGQDGRYVLGSH